jgi:tetratricopeptide (TPR) repeat protein
VKLKAALLLLFLAVYAVLVFPFSGYMRTRPFVERLGYTPQAEVMRIIAADQKNLVAASLIMKVLFYFGTLVEQNKNKLVVPPDYFGMYKTVEAATKLDPYNMDAYYFAQAVLVWDVGKVREANALLEYGMRYRTWDYYLPLFAGFNYAYFLKEYAKAATYYRKAGELSGAELYQSLAGRYLQESGQTDLAIGYLAAMEKGAKNDAIKKTFRTRLRAFLEVKRIEEARDAFLRQSGALPESVEALVQDGYLRPSPVDPYGGRFYLDNGGAVRTTSKFSFKSASREEER